MRRILVILFCGFVFAFALEKQVLAKDYQLKEVTVKPKKNIIVMMRIRDERGRIVKIERLK